MAVTTTWKKINHTGRYKQVLMKMTYEAADTTVTCATGLHQVISYNVSVPSVATKTVTRGVVTAGSIALTVTAPGAGCYLFLTAYGK